MTTYKYFVIYKPYGMLSQFTKEAAHHRTLADLHAFPKDVYPVGRLDKDSEGLLILSNDKSLNDQLLNPKNKHKRIYWAQVDGQVNLSSLGAFEKGVEIKVGKNYYTTLPAEIQLFDEAPIVPDRDPPIRYRANVPTSWLRITLSEGKNRQVRKMCAKIGHPVLRLIRVSIEQLHFENLEVGSITEFKEKDIKKALNL